MRAPLLVALTALLCANAWAAPPNKNQYILVRNRHLLQQPNASAAAPIEDVITHGGGHVDYEGWDRLIATLPDNAVEAIAKHVATKYLQLIRSAPPPTGANAVSQPSSAALNAITNPALPSESTAHVNSQRLRPVANSTSTWDSGTYSYDGAGNITSIGNDTFTYDSLSRLSTSNTKGNAETYTYDAYGNLKLKTTTPAGGTTLTVDLSTSTATNHLDAQTYDTAGNLTGTSSTETNVYDPFNMMRRKDVSGYGSEYYIYNANDERIAVISGCTTAATPDCSGALITVSGRDEAGKVLRQFDVPYPEFATQGWRWLEDYVYRDNVLLASERPAAEGSRRHFHLDHLGSPRLVTGTGGVRLAAHDYYPFGVEITPLRQETLAGFDREEPMKFTGHMRDFNIGVLIENTSYNDYMHARSTVAQWGRFLSVDRHPGEATTPQSWNRYTYASNNPVARIDPDGLRDIYVTQWNARAPYFFGSGSVGHVAAFETSGQVILSQFPDPHGIVGDNTRLDYTETLDKEGRSPDAVFKIFVPDDKQFDSEALAKANAKTWYALPVDDNSTNCVNAVAKALTAGGVPVDQPGFRPSSPVTPGQLADRLADLANTHGQAWSVQRVPADALGSPTKQSVVTVMQMLQGLLSLF